MIQQKYTLITGASEGLGKAFALECARRGHNLVLVALPGKELDNLRKLICENYRVKVFIIPQDLSAENSAATIYQQLLDQDIMVDILINNAGIGNTGLFTEEQTIFFEKQIRINVLATTTLTHCLLPMLKQSSQAHILNVGSLACFFAIPRKQVYGGTKSFIYFFSRSLRAELKRHSINVSVICPGGINSNPAQIMLNKSGSWISRLSLMNPEQVAPIALDGMLSRKAVIIPGRLNRVFLLLDRVVPAFVKNRIIKNQVGNLTVYKNPAFKKRISLDMAS